MMDGFLKLKTKKTTEIFSGLEINIIEFVLAVNQLFHVIH